MQCEHFGGFGSDRIVSGVISLVRLSVANDMWLRFLTAGVGVFLGSCPVV